MDHQKTSPPKTYFTEKGDPRLAFSVMAPGAVNMLNWARHYAGIPFRVTSSYRKDDLAHGSIPCWAVDVAYSQVEGMADFLQGLRELGMTFDKGTGRVNYAFLHRLLVKPGHDMKAITNDGLRIVAGLMMAGFHRIGIADNGHIHADADPDGKKYPGFVVFLEHHTGIFKKKLP